MQGTFESHPDNLDIQARETADNESDAQEDMGQHQGAARKKAARKSHLDAISNVPWETQLLPSNDRATQRRMVDHREREVRYNTLNDTQVTFKPKVTPYPNSPDRVFPGTPCYRMLVNGTFKFIFIIDLKDQLKKELYPAAWNGVARPQSLSYWVVPHFIYRKEAEVTNNKNRWKMAYEIMTGAGRQPPNKKKYDSRYNTLRGYAGGVPIMARNNYIAGYGFQFESYYTLGQDNPMTGIAAAETAPVIKDPLFSPPFFTEVNLPPHGNVAADTYRVIPYPYNQPDRNFPQQPDPPRQNPAPPAPGGPAAAIVLPHESELKALDPTYEGVPNVDWIVTDPRNIEIGKDVLKDACEQAEQLDYYFALSMQGLRGASLPAVWNCIDPEYDVSDRAPVLAQFVKMYMEKFYNKVNGPGESAVEDVVEEALYLHEEFCKGWVHRHHRTLTSEVASAAESLVGVFFEDLCQAFPQGVELTRTHMARYFRRKSEYSGEFANCLYHYMTSLEQMRGNRNASYRAMQTERVAYITAMKKMANMLRERFHAIQTDLVNVDDTTLIFDPRFIDWYYISSQLPAHHRDFDGYAQNFTLFRARPGGRGRGFPPWQQMRN